MSRFEPRAARASELSRCPRMAAYRILGTTAEPYDDRTRRYFARGHLFEQYVAMQLAERYGPGAIEREVPVEWPLGIGHADIGVKPERLLVEVKSSVQPVASSPVFEMAVWQLRFYLRFHPDYDHGALYMINPSDLAGEEVFPVALLDEHIAEIDEAVRRVTVATEGGADMPERVCAKPSDARGRMCAFAETCFEGWEDPEPGQSSDPAVHADVVRWLALRNDERRLKGELDALVEERKTHELHLTAALPVGSTHVGSYLVRRMHKTRKPTFSVKAWEAAGHSIEPLAPFFHGGSEWDEYRVSLAPDGAPVDFGEAPF